MAQELTFRSPSINFREVDATQPTQAPLGTPAGIIGTAKKGPAFVPITVGSFEDFVTKFGGLDPKRFGPYAVNEFLKHRSAVTYLRVLGAGANDTTDDITRTRDTDQVRSAGFVVTGTLSDTDATFAGGHPGSVQFIVAKHDVTVNEAFGYPIFTDNDTYTTTSPPLVRAMVLMASGARLNVTDGDDSLTTGLETDLASLDSSGKFKLVISSSDGASFGNADGFAGLKAFTASLDPDNADYIGKLLNTDPEKFPAEQHLLYADFGVDAQVASASTDISSVGVVSGSANTSLTSGDTSFTFREAFGHFDTRFRAAQGPMVISQPFGTTEFELFRVEALDDGAFANEEIKISISNIRKSNDPGNEFGTFTLNVREFGDTDTNQVVLEQFPELSLDPNSDRFVANVIGDRKLFFNFDAETDSERRLTLQGTFPNRSKFIRVLPTKQLLEGDVSARALPFGFRGYPVLKTADNFSDAVTTAHASRLALEATGSVTLLTASLMPPVPFRFKVTRGTAPTSGFAGNPGSDELANANLHWGVKFERTTDVLNPNKSAKPNTIVSAYTKLLGLEKLDTLVTGSEIDSFNENKFTLARVAFSNTALTDFTGSANAHIREAAYIRNAEPDPAEYRVDDGVISNRMTLGTLVSLTSSVEFNKFASFNKFSFFVRGGFDGVNILDSNATRLNDRATSFDADGGAESTFTSPGLNSNANGVEDKNNGVFSYRIASQIMTDEFASGINILAIPGIRETFITDHAADNVKKFGFAIYLMDIEEYDEDAVRLFKDSSARPDVDETADQFDSRAIDNNYVTTYFPDVQIDDTENNRRVTVPASVAGVAALAFNDRVSFPWFAPAGFNRGALDFVKNTETRINAADRDRLQDSRINPIGTFPREGFVIFGQKTLQFARSALDRVNVRRLMLEAKRIVRDIAAGIVFEPNNPATRQQFTSDAIFQLGLIQAQAGIERFSVVMDETNNTQEDIQNNRLNGRITITPTRAIEQISIQFILTNSGVEFT